MGGVPVRSPHHPTSFPSVRPAFHAPQPCSPGTWGSELVSLLVAGATVRGLRGPQRGGAADVTAVSTGLCVCTGEAGEPPRREGGRGARAGGPPAGPRVHRPVVREGLEGALCRCPWSTWGWPVAVGGIPERDRRGHFKGSLWCSWGEEGAHRRGDLWGAPCSCRAPRAPR